MIENFFHTAKLADNEHLTDIKGGDILNIEAIKNDKEILDLCNCSFTFEYIKRNILSNISYECFNEKFVVIDYDQMIQYIEVANKNEKMCFSLELINSLKTQVNFNKQLLLYRLYA